LAGPGDTWTSEIHSDRRLPSITGLRIFAALAVYASHVGPPHGAPKIINSFFGSGYCGVTVFFVLSGFVLAYNYFDDLRRPQASSVYNFFVARFARVYPLYLLVLIYLVVRQHAFGGDAGGWWQHALAIQAWDGNDSVAYAFNGPAWSISVEFFLYASFPLLIPLIARLRSRRDLILAAVAGTVVMAGVVAWFVVTGRGDLPWADPASAHRWLYRSPLARLGDFALGILAARLFVQMGSTQRATTVASWMGPLAAAAIVALMAWPALFYTAWSWDLAYAVPSVILIFALAAAPASWLSRALSLPLIVLLGEASYAFYLVHAPAISFLGAGQWGTQETSVSMVALEGLNLGAIAVLAVGLHFAVERPTRRYLRRLLSLRNGRELADASSAQPSTP